MNLSEKKCLEIKKNAADFISMYNKEITTHAIRDNFIEISSTMYDTDDEKKLFKAFVIFKDLEEFTLIYKKYNKDPILISEFYHTTPNLVSFFMDVIKNLKQPSSLDNDKDDDEVKRLRRENEHLKKRIFELQNMLYTNEKSNH